MISNTEYENLEPDEQANVDDVIDGLIEQGQEMLERVVAIREDGSYRYDRDDDPYDPMSAEAKAYEYADELPYDGEPGPDPDPDLDIEF